MAGGMMDVDIITNFYVGTTGPDNYVRGPEIVQWGSTNQGDVYTFWSTNYELSFPNGPGEYNVTIQNAPLDNSIGGPHKRYYSTKSKLSVNYLGTCPCE